jgi:cold shock CspA family protein
MAKSQQTFGKKDLEKKRLKKRQEKQEKMEERKVNAKKGGFDSMIAYVDEYGNITDTPPDPSKKKVVDASTIEVSVPKKEKEAADAIRTGKVKFFNTEKGFGFIEQQNSREEYFVHVNGLLDSIKENDMVTFELERGNKGMNAVRVKKL